MLKITSIVLLSTLVVLIRFKLNPSQEGGKEGIK
jgi:hypothetical protein